MQLKSVSQHGFIKLCLLLLKSVELPTSFPGLFSAEERIGGEKPWERGCGTTRLDFSCGLPL